jgi:transposase
MIPPETLAEIRRLFFAEHWKIGTIAAQLQLHADTVRGAVHSDRFNRPRILRPSRLDPYLDFIQKTLERYPRLRATRLYEMVRARGYQGGLVQLRRAVARLRPLPREAFLQLRTFPGEQGQADWAHFGEVRVGAGTRRLSCFVLTLSHSRALGLEFFFDQTIESFLRAHVSAFAQLHGAPRIVLYDNLRAAVLERRGDAVQFHPRLLELCAHYHFAPRPCHVARGNEKGRVERAIRYLRDSFFAARTFTTLDELNQKAWAWRDEVAHRRPWPGDRTRSVAEVFQEERPRLLPLPLHPLDTDLMRAVRTEKTLYVRFDRNDYSLPPAAVGRPLTLVASATAVRLLEGTSEIARHRRSFGTGERIEDPAHIQALLEQKRKAAGSTKGGRLLGAAPEAERLLEAACQRGDSPARQAAELLRLLDDYGQKELRAAVVEALERGTPRASSVAFILARRHRLSRRRPLLPVDLHRRPELQDLNVQPHDPESYDDLTRDDPDA